jgi:mono/diheme cytochrome c family protein
MRRQARYHAYGSSGVFANGLAMQQPPPGTVGFDSATAPSPPGDAGPGAHQFAIACAVCHGVRGDGNSLVGRNMDPPRPPSLLTPAVRLLSDTMLDSLIHFGRGRMPPLGAALSDQGRRDVIVFVRSLSGSRGPGSP